MAQLIFILVNLLCGNILAPLALLLLLPLLAFFWRRYPLKLSNIKSQLVKHLVASLLFSILHVSIMVLLREIAYWSAGGNYDFGPILREFIYEYRKDVWGYAFFLLFYQLYQFIYSRLKGEANLIDSEPEPEQAINHTGS